MRGFVLGNYLLFKLLTMKRIDVLVPDGVSGDWSVTTKVVSEDDAKFSRLRASFQGGRGGVVAGSYKMLKRGGTIVMSNTPDEIKDFYWQFRNLKGRVLINGLGLGCTVQNLIDNPDITEIIVIEKSLDVINLVAPTYLKDKRVKIINADCFEYKPPKGERYDFVWHDIWDNICADNIPEMSKLHRKYGRRTNEQDSWCRAECERLRSQDEMYY